MIELSDDCTPIHNLKNTVTFEVKYKDFGSSTKTWTFHFAPDFKVYLQFGDSGNRVMQFWLMQEGCKYLPTLESHICFFHKDMEKQIILHEEKKINKDLQGWRRFADLSKNPLPDSYKNSDNSYIRITLSVVSENSFQDNIAEGTVDIIKREKGSQTVLSGSVKDSETQLLETLSSDFAKYLDEGLNTDCVLKAGGARIPAHRAMLSVRSAVFKAMFQNETLERTCGEVHMKDINETVLKDILCYMYAGKVHGLTSESATEMFKAADMYDLPELKKACLDFLLENLTVGNICSVACLADTYGVAELEAEVQKYVGENLEEVKKSDDWKQFLSEKPMLVNKILINILSLKK